MYELKNIREAYLKVVNEGMMSLRPVMKLSLDVDYNKTFSMFVRSIKRAFKKIFDSIKGNSNVEYTEFTKIEVLKNSKDDGTLEGTITFRGQGSETVVIAKKAFDSMMYENWAGKWDFRQIDDTTAVVTGVLDWEI